VADCILSEFKPYIPKFKKLDMSRGAYDSKTIRWVVKHLLEITFISFVILVMIVIIGSSRSFILTPRAYLELIILSLFLITFYITYYELSERISSKKIEASLRPMLVFFVWGASFTSSGLVATLFIMITNLIINLTETDIANDFRDITSFYIGILLNFLLGGITLVGASLPALQSLLGQSERKAEPSPQCSREGGGGQQDN